MWKCMQAAHAMGVIGNRQKTRFSGLRSWWKWGQHMFPVWGDRPADAELRHFGFYWFLKDGWGELWVT